MYDQTTNQSIEEMMKKQAAHEFAQMQGQTTGSAGRADACCDQAAEPRREYASCNQLRQLVSPVWDGNLMDKPTRDRLVKGGLVERSLGWNFLTSKGIEFCVVLGILRS